MTGRAVLPGAWRDVRSVLAIRLDSLGDVLMTTPALAALRRGLPGARISLLASPAGAVLAPHLDMIDEVIELDAPWVGSACEDAAGTPALERRFVERLATRRFDAAVIFNACTQSALPAALLARWAGIGVRLAHAHENPYRLLTHWVRDDERVADGMRHEVQRQLDLVAGAGFALPHGECGLRFQRRSADEATLAMRLARVGIGEREPILVVHPGASAASRRWPAERFGAAAAMVAQRAGGRVVIVGGRADAAAVEAAAAHVPQAVCFVGTLALGELAALLARARVVLCNNSAPAHLAAAVGSPVVVAYALTNPRHVPWRARSRVLCHDVPCRHCLLSACAEGHPLCLQGVDASSMAQAALDLIAEEQPAVQVAAS